MVCTGDPAAHALAVIGETLGDDALTEGPGEEKSPCRWR